MNTDFNHSELHLNIAEIFSQSSDGVNTVYFGRKQSSGNCCGEPSIVFGVNKKLPIDQVPSGELIPKTINITGVEYKTDVVETQVAKPLTCYRGGAFNSGANYQLAYGFYPQISGGVRIVPISSLNQYGPWRFNNANGTLGVLVKDSHDGTIVGLTNAHVAIADDLHTSYRKISEQTITTRDGQKSAKITGYYYKGAYDNITGTVRFNNRGGYNDVRFQDIMYSVGSTDYFNGGNPLPENIRKDLALGSTTIGTVKRYVPMKTGTSINNINLVDAAIFSIKKELMDINSTRLALIEKDRGLVLSDNNGGIFFGGVQTSINTLAMPFASTSELDGLMPGGPHEGIPVYSVGSRTGPKGLSCPLEVFAVGASQQVLHHGGGIATLGDAIGFRYRSYCKDIQNIFLNPDLKQFGTGETDEDLEYKLYPSYYGDSGSVVIGNFYGTMKIIGLVSALNTHTASCSLTLEYMTKKSLDLINRGILSADWASIFTDAIQSMAPDDPHSILSTWPRLNFTYPVAYVCRIDHIATSLGVESIPANSQMNTSYSASKPVNRDYILRPPGDTRAKIVYNGKTYYQAGLTDDPGDITDV